MLTGRGRPGRGSFLGQGVSSANIVARLREMSYDGFRRPLDLLDLA